MADYFTDLVDKPRAARRKTEAELDAAGSWRGVRRRKARRVWAERTRAADRVVPKVRIPDVRKTILELPGYDPWREAAGYTFRPARARAAIAWVHTHITHTKGPKAKAPDPFILARWEQAFMANLFGWYREGTELRRYAEAFLGVARGNGKTTFAAAILNFIAMNDEEPGAEYYSAAADVSQARLIRDQAAQMIRQDALLTDRSRIMHSMIEFDGGSGIFRALSSEAGTKHGLNAHLVLIDELHAHKNRDLRDVLVTSTGKRDQPLVIYFTTSDYERVSVCNEVWDHARKVRDGIVPDAAFLPAIWEADKDDDWTIEETWRKANPNLEGAHGETSVPLRYIRRECERAQEIPAYEAVFKRLHLNVRTEAETRLMPMTDWDLCAEHPILQGNYFAGVDLSSTEDLTSVVFYFPETGAIVPLFFIPKFGATAREKRDRVPYLAWEAGGHIELTPGNRVDYACVRRAINEFAAANPGLQDIGIDPWQSAHLMSDLQVDGFEVVAFPQGFREFNVPTKEVLKLAAEGKLAHGGQPVLRYCVSNVNAITDSQGRIRPSKSKSKSVGRIDGFVALVMAVGRSLDSDPEDASVYDTEPLFVI